MPARQSGLYRRTFCIQQQTQTLRRTAVYRGWQAAAWWLERTRQHTFGRKERVEMTGENGAPLRIQVDAADLEEKITQVLEARKG